MLKLNKSKRFGVISLVVISVLVLLSLLPLPMLIGSMVGIWYFSKKEPNKKKRNHAISLAALSMLFFLATTGENQSAPDMQSNSLAAQQSSSSVESAEESRKKKESAATSDSIRKEEEKKKAVAESESKEKAEQAIKESKEAVEKEKKKKADAVESDRKKVQTSAPSVPDGEKYVVINDNTPFFTDEDISSTEPWESYGELDEWYRVTPANAVLGVELMPAEERGDISSVKPTGWDQREYDIVSGGWLYNRSHLIGFQMTGQNANPKNLMTGTRWFNAEGMLPFENFVANYIEETENHVRYRVTPYFEGENLLASGIFMEGFSIEDNGEGLKFNIYVPNIQPGVGLDYATGDSWLLDPPAPKVEEPVYEESVPEEPVYEEPIAEEPVYEEPIAEEPAPNVWYKNCTEVRAAGAAPIYPGDPGWEPKFDRDNDGVGCE